MFIKVLLTSWSRSKLCLLSSYGYYLYLTTIISRTSLFAAYIYRYPMQSTENTTSKCSYYCSLTVQHWYIFTRITWYMMYIKLHDIFSVARYRHARRHWCRVCQLVERSLLTDRCQLSQQPGPDEHHVGRLQLGPGSATVQHCTVHSNCWCCRCAVDQHRFIDICRDCQQFWFNQPSVSAQVSVKKIINGLTYLHGSDGFPNRQYPCLHFTLSCTSNSFI